MPSEWFLMYVETNGREAEDFMQELRSVGDPLGMRFPKPHEIPIRRDKDNERGWADELRRIRSDAKTVLYGCGWSVILIVL